MSGSRLFRQALRGILLFASVTGAAGCVHVPSGAELDQRFSAGWRPSKAYCAWGGETAQLGAYCARINFGREGALAILQAVNLQVLDEAPGGAMPPEQHIERAAAALEPYVQDYAVAALEWRDPAGGRCHVSALVTDQVTGARFVLDNGDAIPAGAHVGTYEELAIVATAPRACRRG